MTNQEYEKLKTISNNIRKHIINSASVNIPYHFGGSFSIIEILSYFYYKEIDLSKEKSRRNTFILSKGHACYALYSLFFEFGYISFKELCNYKKIGCRLQGHPDRKNIPGVDMSTGSLGQGLSSANGMAIAGKMDNKDYRVYCILGDGEIEEGQIWEAAMTSSKNKLDNLCVIVDNNNLQIDGTIEEVMSSYPIDEKFKSFGFQIINIDGHNIKEIIDAFDVAKNIKGKPTCIIAKTVKGKGVSFMENQVGWHGKAPNDEQYRIAMEELS